MTDLDKDVRDLAGKVAVNQGLKLVASIGVPRVYAIVRDWGSHKELVLNYRPFPEVVEWVKAQALKGGEE